MTSLHPKLGLIQFHVTRSEALELVSKFHKQLEFNIALLLSHPFRVKAIKRVEELDDLLSIESDNPGEVFLFLTHCKIFEGSADQYQFNSSNPDGITFLLGRLCDGHLYESLLSPRCLSVNCTTLLKAIKKQLRKISMTGGRWVGPTGNVENDSKHLYSIGSADLARNGVRLMPIAGKVEFVPNLQAVNEALKSEKDVKPAGSAHTPEKGAQE